VALVGLRQRGSTYFCGFIEATSGSLGRRQEAGAPARLANERGSGAPAMETGQDRTSCAPSKELS